MEFNRNQYFFAGVLVLLIGLQLRFVSSIELTDEVTRALNERAPAAADNSQFSFASAQQVVGAPLGRRVLTPPEWLGWCLISVGAVFVLHSLAMPKPS